MRFIKGNKFVYHTGGKDLHVFHEQHVERISMVQHMNFPSNSIDETDGRVLELMLQVLT